MHSTDDGAQSAVSIPSVWIGSILVRFIGCKDTDTLLLVPVADDAFQWVFDGNPAIPASDLFRTTGEAWDFAFESWNHVMLHHFDRLPV